MNISPKYSAEDVLRIMHSLISQLEEEVYNEHNVTKVKPDRIVIRGFVKPEPKKRGRPRKS
jgi:hypothetical protein